MRDAFFPLQHFTVRDMQTRAQALRSRSLIAVTHKVRRQRLKNWGMWPQNRT